MIELNNEELNEQNSSNNVKIDPYIDTVTSSKRTPLEKLRIFLSILGSVLIAFGKVFDNLSWLLAVGGTILLAEMGLFPSIRNLLERKIIRRKAFYIQFFVRMLLLLCFFLTFIPILRYEKELPVFLYWLCLLSFLIFFIYALIEDLNDQIVSAAKKRRSSLILTILVQFLLILVIVGMIGFYASDYKTMFPEYLTLEVTQSPDRISVLSMDSIRNQEYSFKDISEITDQSLFDAFMRDLSGKSTRLNWIETTEYKRFTRLHQPQYMINLMWKEELLNRNLLAFDGFTDLYFIGRRLIIAPGEYDVPRRLIKLKAYYQIELSDDTIKLLSSFLSKQ